MAIELTPTQIQRTDFPIAKKGYDVDAVRAHLRDAAAALENALRRAKLAEDRARRAEEALMQAQQQMQAAAVPEKQLAEETERVLRTARESAAAIEEEARRKAEQMIAEAQNNAAALVAQAEARAREAEENARRMVAEAQQAAAASVAGQVEEEARAKAAEIVREAELKAQSILQQIEAEREAKLKELEAKAREIEAKRKQALEEVQARWEAALADVEAKKAAIRAELEAAGLKGALKKKKLKTKSGRIVSGAIEEAREVATEARAAEKVASGPLKPAAASLRSGPVPAGERESAGEGSEEVAEAIASVETTLASVSTAKETVEAPAAAEEEGPGQPSDTKFDALFGRFKSETPAVPRSPATAPAGGAGEGTRPSGPVPAGAESMEAGALGSISSIEVPVPSEAEIDVPEAQQKIVVVLRKQLVRKLKRALQEEQNIAVETIQKAGGRGEATALVPAQADMLKRIRSHTDAVLYELSRIGWGAAGGSDGEVPAINFEGIVGPKLVEPLRSQLLSAVSEGLGAGDDVSALCERIHNVFRVWKGPELADLAALLAHDAFVSGKTASVRS